MRRMAGNRTRGANRFGLFLFLLITYAFLAGMSLGKVITNLKHDPSDVAYYLVSSVLWIVLTFSFAFLVHREHRRQVQQA